MNKKAVQHARELITKGEVVKDECDDWSEHQPSAEKESEFIREHGFAEYAKWHLGIDDEDNEETKGRYKFPYGDFKKVHRCAVISAESRAGQYKHETIESAAEELLTLIDERGSRAQGREH